MNTATLAFLIGSAILAQVLTLALLGFYRQRGRYLALASGAARVVAPPQRRAKTVPAQAPALPVATTAVGPAVGEPSGPVTPAVSAPIMVSFSRSGKQAQWTPGSGSLLDLAESAGVLVAPGCRVGSCGCCETAVESGEVAYAKTPEVRIESGHCLLCIGTAKGDLTLALWFDACVECHRSGDEKEGEHQGRSGKRGHGKEGKDGDEDEDEEKEGDD